MEKEVENGGTSAKCGVRRLEHSSSSGQFEHVGPAGRCDDCHRVFLDQNHVGVSNPAADGNALAVDDGGWIFGAKEDALQFVGGGRGFGCVKCRVVGGEGG